MATEAVLLGFVEEFRRPGETVIQPGRFAAALNLQIQELAQIAGVHRTTISEAPGNARLQNYMRDALRVISAAMDVTGDRDRALYWYRNAPIREFGHQTAEQLVSARQTEAVLSYLNSIEGGSTG
jgi:hypothetical protein